MSIQAGSRRAAQVWLLLGSLLIDVIPESIKPSPPHHQMVHLTHCNSAPAAIPTISTISGTHAIGPTSHIPSNRVASSEAASKMTHQTHASTAPVQPCTVTQTYPQALSPGQRSRSNNSSGTSASREQAGEREALPLTKPPPNSRNLTPASSRSSSPRHIPLSLPPVPALPPSTTMTPASLTPRRPSVLISSAALAHGHARRPSVYSRASATHSESPSTPSITISDRSLRHVGEGALDDSDSSESSENRELVSADPRDSQSENEMDVSSEVPQRHIISKSRSLSMGRTGPVHPSPLSRLAGQRWTEDEYNDGAEEREEDEASPSPGSTDTDGGDDSGRDSESSIKLRKIRAESVSVTRTRPRKNATAKRMRSHARNATVAALAAPSLPLSPSPVLLSAPESPNQLEQASHSSIRTVTAGSVREQELQQHDKDAVQVDTESVAYQTWCDMTESQRRTVMKEEAQLREVAWRALRDAVEAFAEAVSDCMEVMSCTNGYPSGRCSDVRYVGAHCSQGTQDQQKEMFAVPRGIYW